MIDTTTIDSYLTALIASAPAGCAVWVEISFRVSDPPGRAGFRAFAWPGGLVVARVYEN